MTTIVVPWLAHATKFLLSFWTSRRTRIHPGPCAGAPVAPIRIGCHNNEAEVVDSPRFVVGILLTVCIAVGLVVLITAGLGASGFEIDPNK